MVPATRGVMHRPDLPTNCAGAARSLLPMAVPLPVVPPPRALRVLHVEDSESDAGLVQRALARGGFTVEATRVETADDMRARLRDQA